ncbi:AMMECR1 domain-containing protein [candidate division TA06 bacterium]|uniref:AMMECR1 domain-containing protein n=1 Tax=candidate division TA06 bacterium TaxID=2250710 RepID=A0A660SBS3_UNCT6|nr:MAG: AMMECR1 domain-containing protein [candidate division TA06 bacterium]
MTRKSSIDLGLDDRQQQILLAVVKETVYAKLSGKKLPKYNFEDRIFQERRGAFVTLHKHGQLRGCIGYIVGIAPLLDTIQRMAIASAFEDPRFSSLEKEEFKYLNIEISVLTPLKKVKDISEIKIGRDGLLIRKGFYQGLLLPQVAEEEGWDVETFLKHTCLKAGLYPDVWKEEGTTIEKFSAQIFSQDVEKILDIKAIQKKFNSDKSVRE